MSQQYELRASFSISDEKDELNQHRVLLENLYIILPENLPKSNISSATNTPYVKPSVSQFENTIHMPQKSVKPVEEKEQLLYTDTSSDEEVQAASPEYHWKNIDPYTFTTSSKPSYSSVLNPTIDPFDFKVSSDKNSSNSTPPPKSKSVTVPPAPMKASRSSSYKENSFSTKDDELFNLIGQTHNLPIIPSNTSFSRENPQVVYNSYYMNPNRMSYWYFLSYCTNNTFPQHITTLVDKMVYYLLVVCCFNWNGSFKNICEMKEDFDRQRLLYSFFLKEKLQWNYGIYLLYKSWAEKSKEVKESNMNRWQKMNHFFKLYYKEL